MNKIQKLAFMFLLSVGLILCAGCSRTHSDSSNSDVETIEYSETFDEPKGLNELNSLGEGLIVSNMGIDCDKVFECSPVEEISKLGLLTNDTLVIAIDVNELGLKEFTLLSVGNKKEIEMTPVYGTDSVYTVVKVIFKNIEVDKACQSVKDFENKFSMLASMFAYCVIENDKIKEIRSICSKWPKYDDVKLNAFSRRRSAGKIKYKIKKESIYDSCFRNIKDYKILHDSITTILPNRICKEDIDSLLDSVLRSLSFAKALSISYDYDGKTLKDYVSNDDTLYYMTEQIIEDGYFLSLLSLEGSKVNNYDRLRYISGNMKFEDYRFRDPQFLWDDIEEHTGISRDPLNFRALIIFYVKDGSIWKMKRIDDMTEGARKYYNAIADK